MIADPLWSCFMLLCGPLRYCRSYVKKVKGKVFPYSLPSVGPGVDPGVHVVCCNVEDLNFGMQNLRPSNIKVILQRPSCGSPIAVASGFIAGAAPVVTVNE